MRSLSAAVVLGCLFVATGCASGSSPQATSVPASPALPAQEPTISETNAARLKPAVTATVANAQDIAWSPSSDALFIASRDSAYSLAAAGGQLQRLVNVAEPAFVASISSLGQTATSGGSGPIEIHEKRGSAAVQTIPAGPTLSLARFSADGALLVTTRVDRIAADIWDLRTGQMVKELIGFETAAPVDGVRFSPDGKSLIWISRGTVQIQDIATGRLGPVFSHQDFVSGLALSLDGRVLATALADKVMLWNSASGGVIATVPQAGAAIDVSFSPDGQIIAVATSEDVAFWTVTGQKYAGRVGGSIRQVLFSPDGRFLASVDQDGVVSIWSLS